MTLEKALAAAFADLKAQIKAELREELLQELRAASADRRLTVQEAAEYTGISAQLLYRLCAERRIPHIRIGDSESRKPKILFNAASLDAWLRQQERLHYDPASFYQPGQTNGRENLFDSTGRRAL